MTYAAKLDALQSLKLLVGYFIPGTAFHAHLGP